MNKDDYEIIDNFLSPEDFEFVRTTLEGSDLPWFFNNGVLDEVDEKSLNDYQLTHSFYRHPVTYSMHYDALQPLLKKIKHRVLLKVKANLNPRTEEPFQHGFHIDYPDPAENQRTAVFYINDNNGLTIFEDGTSVKSFANRLLVFKSNILHTGTTCTDKKCRILINLNYFI